MYFDKAEKMSLFVIYYEISKTTSEASLKKN